jgi:hypothetical protein
LSITLVYIHTLSQDNVMYSVHVTGRSGDRRGSGTPNSEIVYKHRRRDSIPLRVFNYIKQQFHSDQIPGEIIQLSI